MDILMVYQLTRKLPILSRNKQEESIFLFFFGQTDRQRNTQRESKTDNKGSPKTADLRTTETATDTQTHQDTINSVTYQSVTISTLPYTWAGQVLGAQC